MTDWTAYYSSPGTFTSVTRAITARKVLKGLRSIAPPGRLDICELGGANSCVANTILTSLPIRHYSIEDMNEYGLSLVEQWGDGRIDTKRSDVTEPYDGRLYDLVFSIGLIEHFDSKGTAKVIQAHFDRCKPGGGVLITYPTPTGLYRAIRSGAEMGKVWQFSDERPLRWPEVRAAVPNDWRLVSRSINWWIGLTQEYVAFTKFGSKPHEIVVE